MNPIIVPLRNALHLTLAAHRTFLDQDIPVELLYINNASTDNTAQWLASLLDVCVINNDPPLGVAASWNQGLRWWFGKGAEYVLVVNNDVELRPDTYYELLADGGGFVTAVGVNTREQLGTTTEKGKRPHPDFSCYLIRKWVWEKVGEFDENFKGAYAEDWDWHTRLHKAGVEAYCIDLPFYHVGAATLQDLLPWEAVQVCKQADANRAYYARKWGIKGGSEEYYAMFGAAPTGVE